MFRLEARPALKGQIGPCVWKDAMLRLTAEESIKPVMLPPGRAKLTTNPAPTGSGTCANTIGTVRVARCKGPTAALPT
jgi:hypothetical protein